MPTEKNGPLFGFQLHHVQLSIPKGSEDACRRFYVDILGLEEVPKPPVLAARGGMWLRSETVEVHLGVEEDFRPAKKAHPAFVARNFDAFVAHLQMKNVSLTWDDNLPGKRRFYVHDNLGNRLEFIEP